MPDGSTTLHEPAEKLTIETIERHRALVSLMEELEAVDWYTQRIDASTDPELRALLAHNRDEEQEHAAMALEWLRRRDPNFDRQLRRYLFTDGPIVHEEGDAGRDGDGQSRAFHPIDGGLGIGALHEEAAL